MTGAHVARVAGYVLVLLFFALGLSSNGWAITFHGDLSSSSPGELNMWLGQTLLLFPGCVLIGYGFSPQWGRAILEAGRDIQRLTARQRAVGAVALTILAVVLARIGRMKFLLDLPVSDDEYAVEFGGRILASGHLMTQLPLPREAIPDLFLHFRDGAVGSFDWIGGQAVAAVASLTGLESLAWALVAAVPVPVLATLVGRRLGPHWGFAAAILFLCSPMAFLLSMTTHAHLASRAVLALALLAFWFADRSGGLHRWAATGVLLGLAFLCRPAEIAFFSLPLLVWTGIQTLRRSPAYRAALPGLLLGGAAPALIFVWHAYAMTGDPFLPARFANPDHGDVRTSFVLRRLGNNVGYNVLMLAIWFLGPLGLVLVAAGVLTDRFTKLLASCVVADLCLAFVHDNSGLHIVGPIHYSECAVPLTVIATHGLANLLRGARRHGFDPRVVAAPAAVALALGLITLSVVQGFALRNQAEVQREVYRAVEGAARQPGDPRAVVLAPAFLSVVTGVPRLGDVGTWVHEWRRPQLDLSDDVLVLRDAPQAERAVRQQFPDRRLFRMQRDEEGRFFQLVPLEGGSPVPLSALQISEGR